jgi:hypothetical protein
MQNAPYRQLSRGENPGPSGEATISTSQTIACRRSIFFLRFDEYVSMSEESFDVFWTKFLRSVDMLLCIVGFNCNESKIHRRTDDTNSFVVANGLSNQRRRSARSFAVCMDARLWRAVTKKDLASGWQFPVAVDDVTDRMLGKQGISGPISDQHFRQCRAE